MICLWNGSAGLAYSPPRLHRVSDFFVVVIIYSVSFFWVNFHFTGLNLQFLLDCQSCSGCAEVDKTTTMMLMMILMQVMMKDLVTPVAVDDIRKVVRKCLENASLINYTKVNEMARNESKTC